MAGLGGRPGRGCGALPGGVGGRCVRDVRSVSLLVVDRPLTGAGLSSVAGLLGPDGPKYWSESPTNETGLWLAFSSSTKSLA